MKPMPLLEWVEERRANCERIAKMRSGVDRAEWLEDERYFADILKALRHHEASPAQTEVPEGCTPADAMVLREANHVFAEENHHLRRCLRFYANGEHYTGLVNWEGPSGDDNWLCPPIDDDDRAEFFAQLDEALVEDGSVARDTLRTGKFECEPDEEPKLVEGEPEWKIEQEAQRASLYVNSTPEKPKCSNSTK